MLSQRWGCTLAAIRTLRANIESQEHKDIQQERVLCATSDVFTVLIKIHTCVLQAVVQRAVWQEYIDHITHGKCSTSPYQKSHI